MLNEVINHLRDREYMSGVDRDKSRVKATGEVFTPTPLVQEILGQLPLEQFIDHTKTFLDPSCGDGQFLSEVIIKKIENGSTYEQALNTTYGADLMADNCIACIERLYGAEECISTEILTGKNIPKNWQADGLLAVFKIYSPMNPKGKICNIVQADGLKYDFHFDDITARRKDAREKAKLAKKKATRAKPKRKATKKTVVKRKDQTKIKSTEAQEVNT
jgi:hypothetical protein